MDDFLEILQLPNPLLRDRINKELLENPVLEFQFSEADNEHDHGLIADIAVDRSQAGEYEVRLPDDGLAILSISQRYIELYREPTTDPKAREYLGREIKKAHRLVEALERRRAILKQVGVAIFRQQRAFLEHGLGHIVSLSAEQVVREIGAEVPTVRRAVKNKQVRTPHGVVSLDGFILRLPSPSDN